MFNVHSNISAEQKQLFGHAYEKHNSCSITNPNIMNVLDSSKKLQSNKSSKKSPKSCQNDSNSQEKYTNKQ